MKRLLLIFLTLALLILLLAACNHEQAADPQSSTTAPPMSKTTAITEVFSTTAFAAKISEKEALHLVNQSMCFSSGEIKLSRIPLRGMQWTLENESGCISCSSAPNLDESGNWVYTVTLCEYIYRPDADGVEQLHHITINSQCYVNAETREIIGAFWNP